MENLAVTLNFIFCFFTICIPVEACFNDSTKTRRWYIPDYIPVQFAGNIGLLSSGAGFTSSKGNYQLGILYGYTPASVAHSNIHTLTAKNVFPLCHYPLKNNQIFSPYLGLG